MTKIALAFVQVVEKSKRLQVQLEPWALKLQPSHHCIRSWVLYVTTNCVP